jgi:hypothetical protein
MSKTNIEKLNFVDRVQDVAAKAGLLLMASAAVIGTVELTDGREKVVLVRPTMAFAPVSSNGTDTLRREREEEAGSHYITYGTAIRTATHSGKK